MTLKEIDFRVWSNQENDYIELLRTKDNRFYKLKDNIPYLIPDDLIANEEYYTIEFYTGYKDKEGNKIYENDRVKAYAENESCFIEGRIYVDLGNKEARIIADDNQAIFDLRDTHNGLYKILQITGNTHLGNFSNQEESNQQTQIHKKRHR